MPTRALTMIFLLTAAALCACGAGVEEPERRTDRSSECDRYDDACDEIGPFGDSDYGPWGDDGGEDEAPDGEQAR